VLVFHAAAARRVLVGAPVGMLDRGGDMDRDARFDDCK
jgi:hypothetical protein